MIGKPEGSARYQRRELLDLDSVKLFNANAKEVTHVDKGRSVRHGGNHPMFEAPKFSIGNHKEIATPASGIQEIQVRDLLVEFIESCQAALSRWGILWPLLPRARSTGRERLKFGV